MIWFYDETPSTEAWTNGFVGSIPPSLGNLSSLEKLSLALNHLEGSITLALGRLFEFESFRFESIDRSLKVPK
ncbi:hypothetical protein Ahy_A07g031949 [Arachis hypogaea]|uniref:LRR receptor-like serine/threonine-protein kinase n=1 Tax=Arachis hypogaea TaxID=3818 RepID=A0A445C5N0_ARAHY|nr:hypothetical protein Ahy_A07g031949 [Arachis hypogaea]